MATTRRTGWLVGLALGAAGCAIFIVLPADSVSSTVAYQTTAIATLAVLVTAILRMPGNARAVWWAVLGYSALSTLGDLAYTVDTASGGDRPYPGVADAIYLAAYACGFVALGLLIRIVNRGRSLEAWIDTTILGIAWASAVALFIVEPTLAAGDSDVVAVGVGVGYPVIDFFLLAGLGRILVSAGGERLNRAIVTLVSALLITLAADLYYAYTSANGLDNLAPTWLDALYLVAFIMMAAAANAPGATSIHVTRRAMDTGPPGPIRTLALGLAAVLVPLMLLAAALNQGDATNKVLAAGCLVMVLLILWRVRLLLSVVHRQSAQLRSMSRADSLTGLPNRRSFDFELKRFEQSSADGRATLTIAMMDLDHFKAFNDEFGHQAGDAALVSCSRAWQDAVIPPALLARYGGEEFAILLPGTGLIAAREVLGRIRDATPAGQTASIGFAERWPGESGFETMSRADRALYRAKTGRNRIVSDRLAEPQPPGTALS